MSVESVKEFFTSIGLAERVVEHATASDTVEHAAELIGCKPAEIAKTMSLYIGEAPILIIAAGDVKIDNQKYKAQFIQKAIMIPFDTVESLTGHKAGGVGPYGVKAGVKIYLDESLKRFDVVYVGGGDDKTTVKTSVDELAKYTGFISWVDVCKLREEQQI
ncbi:MAG: YbaK/EbsC family protein [Firmicutes bacterium]|nr:YbaK/EbsC family protein [Bacillota bacterium]